MPVYGGIHLSGLKSGRYLPQILYKEQYAIAKVALFDVHM